MPWADLHSPSPAMGILGARTRAARPGTEVTEYHGAIRWAEYLLAATNGELTPEDYARIADDAPSGLGEWIFAGALNGRPEWRLKELRSGVVRQSDAEIDVAVRMRRLADGFVEQAVAELLATAPDVVGFTTTFQQNTSSLAVAGRLKQVRPSTRVVLGGANCEGPMGAALHRNHPFVDFVVRGEGELVFPRLLDRIAADQDAAGLEGVCWWRDERSIANPESPSPVPVEVIPVPDYDQWQRVIEASPVLSYGSPCLLIEASRGCWWGERHHCTFCGLNDAMIKFRSKPPDRLWAELSGLVRRHQILDVFFTDNILDLAYYDEVLPLVAASGWDLRIFFEVKSNMRPGQLERLAAAGVVELQPGIESLSSRVLKLMDKGVTATANLRLLRDSEALSITVTWNYLYGFPEERAEDYLQVIAQLPALVHLQPPRAVARVALERFSPFFERPELGFATRSPKPFYGLVYDLPEAELGDLAYYFDCEEAGITGDPERTLHEAVGRWQRAHPDSTLVVSENPGGSLLIADRRQGWPVRDHVLTGWHAAAYRALERGRSAKALTDRLTGDDGYAVDPGTVSAWLETAHRDGLTYDDDGTFVALATRGVPLRAYARPDAVEVR
ncbi:RiPP maturation radical SAM C-methyltransferase [Sphaerisporangium corydalis]|uniref:RiPP maturation radical SAM C-methyltransferase n=1 Tax=Sphaerisporangium corydalis TaxID=1441875 RepID=A0ABV9EFA4_9ACTN|nr:RiPP maturation radical SAM C-methyltransferase [Sphaerisporangium corydalis]